MKTTHNPKKPSHLTRLAEQFVNTLEDEGYVISVEHATALVRKRGEDIALSVGLTYKHVLYHYMNEATVEMMARNTAVNLREAGITLGPLTHSGPSKA